MRIQNINQNNYQSKNIGFKQNFHSRVRGFGCGRNCDGQLMSDLLLLRFTEALTGLKKGAIYLTGSLLKGIDMYYLDFVTRVKLEMAVDENAKNAILREIRTSSETGKVDVSTHGLCSEVESYHLIKSKDRYIKDIN